MSLPGFDAGVAVRLDRERRDEGRRVLRNVASFGTFVIGPLGLAMLSRTLGLEGYGRWWWTYGLIEAATIVGMFSADLFIRREVPRLLLLDARDEIVSTVASGVAVVCGFGLCTAALQCLLARSLAHAQRDADLIPFLVVLAAQPLLFNVSNVFAAALQSLDVLGKVAVLRGVTLPAAQVGILYFAWRVAGRRELATVGTLAILLAMSVAGVVTIAALYSRRLPLGRTIALAFRPARAREILRYGARLLPPSILWTLGGKLDIYVLGAHVAPAMVGVYATCLLFAGTLPNIRALFDPVAQAQIGALYTVDRGAVGASLHRMTRLSALVLTPLFVLLVVAGPLLLAYLLGRPVPMATTPLIILCIGQLLGSVAVAAWLLPMERPGTTLTTIAGATLAVKLILLLALVPRYTLAGAAIATAVGTIIAQQGQALAGIWRLPAGARESRRWVGPLLSGAFAAAIGRALLPPLRRWMGEPAGVAMATAVALLVLGITLLIFLQPSEQAAVRTWFRLVLHRSVRP
jgi:O-antigen/teichoic acid export membrane protein